MATGELASLRAELARIDAACVQLLAERVAVARRVGEHKRAHGLATLDSRREAEVVAAAGRLARESGLDEEAVRGVFWQVIAMCRRAQQDQP